MTFANHPKPSAPNKPTSGGGVWDDLSSLAGPGQDSSLPLQYQAPSRAQPTQDQISMSNSNLSAGLISGIVTQTGMGMDTLRLQHAPAPFPLQPAVSSNPPPLSATFPTFFGTPPQQPFRQEVWGTASTHPSMIISQPTSTAAFFQPQPQTSFQVHTPSNQNFFSHSPSQQPLMSAPITQTHFFTPSPTHSHSPQLQLAMPTQTGFFPSAPGQIGSMSVGQNPGVVAGSVGQSGFLATTTMQMQQQMLLQQQAQQQPVVAGMQPVIMTPNGMGGVGFSGGGPMYAQGQQWGIM